MRLDTQQIIDNTGSHIIHLYPALNVRTDTNGNAQQMLRNYREAVITDTHIVTKS